MSTSVADIISSLRDGDNVSANKAFNGVMANKMKTTLDAKKIEIASNLGKKLPEAEEEQES